MAGHTKTVGRRSADRDPGPVTVLLARDGGEEDSVTLRQGSLVLGSAPGCDLRASDPTVSRQHARLELLQHGVRVVDLGSRNGTLHHGARLKEAVLQPPFRLRLGETEVRVAPLDAEPLRVDGPPEELNGLIGSSPAMREVIAVLRRVAPTDGTLLLNGETGVGKDVAANAVHLASGRKGPFVVFDCSTASSGLLASELFGHVKGAFTDARTDRRGAVEEAAGGTLFLDEVGELHPSLQPSLLRLLESREIRPLGSNRARKVDVRVVAATHRDLQEEVAQGRFREDLYYRLSLFQVTLPPLRERLEDLPLLARRVLEAQGASLVLDDAMLAALAGYPWPGNVRELRNVLLRTAALGGPPRLTRARQGARAAPRAEPEAEPPLPADYHQAREAVMARFEREFLAQLLRRHGDNVSRAARESGIGRAQLYRLMKRHQLGSAGSKARARSTR